MVKEEYPYIAIIEEVYKTKTGNFLCREKGKDLNIHLYEWPIFIAKEDTQKITTLPVYGILIKDYNSAFRITKE